MCKTKLMSRWVNILTGVAICALVGVFAVSDSWAAMCMVGYDKSKCDSKSPSASPSPKPCTGSNCCTGANCDSIPVDCERLGYKLYAAKPNDSSIWPTKALKNGQNDTANWQCDACMKGNDIVWEKNYVRYNCYQLCKDPASATNIKGGTGPISNWFLNTEEEFAGEGGVITRKVNSRFNSTRRADSTNSRHVYREQFVLTSDDCKVVAGTKEVNGRVVEKKKFEWVTRFICGKCDRLCDGATITAGCYKPCQNPYTLEDGTRCCNETTLELMNKNNQLLTEENKVGNNLTYVIGGKDAWHTPRYAQVPENNGGCYEITGEQTAADGSTCYTEEPKECGLCTKTDESCACVAKTCGDFAAEKGYEYGEEAGKVIDLTSRSLYNGNVKIGGVCYVPDIINDGCYGEQTSNDGTSVTVSKCARIEKLVCPDGSNGDSECSCGIGCPSGYAQMDKPGEAGYSSVLASNYSINLEPYKVGDENKKSCVKLADDGHTCVQGYEVQCYKWIECSDVAEFLRGNGSGGCECNTSLGFFSDPKQINCHIPDGEGACTAKADGSRAGPCFASTGQNATYYDTQDGNNFKSHDGSQNIGQVACYYEPHVVCPSPLVDNGDCTCACGSDYYTNDDEVPECAICRGNTRTPGNCYASGTEYGYWTDTGKGDHTEVCYIYDFVDCPAAGLADDPETECGCKCPSDETPGPSSEDDDCDGVLYNCTDYNYSYTNRSGGTTSLVCHSKTSASCSGIVVQVNGKNECVDCDYLTAHDEDFSGSWSSGGDNSCDCGLTKWSKTYTGEGGKTLTCTKCENNATNRTCIDAGKIPADATTPYPNGDNDWWCELKSLTSCDAWEDGHQVYCQEGKTNNATYVGLSPCTSIRGLYTTPCEGSEVAKNRCAYKCEEYHKCETNDSCPRYTSSTCPEGTTYVASTKRPCQSTADGGNYESQKGYCQKGDLFCDNSSSYNNDTCLTAEERYEEYGE